MTYCLVITISTLVVSSTGNRANLISDTFSQLQQLHILQRSTAEADEFPRHKSAFLSPAVGMVPGVSSAASASNKVHKFFTFGCLGYRKMGLTEEGFKRCFVAKSVSRKGETVRLLPPKPSH